VPACWPALTVGDLEDLDGDSTAPSMDDDQRKLHRSSASFGGSNSPLAASRSRETEGGPTGPSVDWKERTVWCEVGRCWVSASKQAWQVPRGAALFCCPVMRCRPGKEPQLDGGESVTLG
jgi:hypothetical protein